MSSPEPHLWDNDSVVRFDPHAYSYAYYEPGPATRHVNIPVPSHHHHHHNNHHSHHQQQLQPSTSSSPGPSRLLTLDPLLTLPGTSSDLHPRTCPRSRHNRHTYMTRYGTEENIYEEITEMARCAGPHRMRTQHDQSLISLNQALVEEEVRRVQSRHKRILGELNLSVEAMLMPSPSSNENSDEAERDGEHDDQLADLLSVGPTDELLSPASASCHPLVDLDSGFSGSSSGASYQSAVGSLRRGPNSSSNSSSRPRSSLSFARTATPNASSTISSSGNYSTATRKKGDSSSCSASSNNTNKCNTAGNSGKSFWSRKGWRKLAGFASSNNINKTTVAFDAVECDW